MNILNCEYRIRIISTKIGTKICGKLVEKSVENLGKIGKKMVEKSVEKSGKTGEKICDKNR